MKRVTILIIGMILMILCSGCAINFNSNQCVPLADAPEQIQNQVDGLYQQTLDALKTGNEEGIMNIASSQLKENANNLGVLMEQAKNILTDAPTIMGEYYLTFAQTGENTATLTARDISNPDYYFHVQPIAKEMAVVFATIEKGTITYIIAQVYINENASWKLSGVFTSDYAYHAMNAPQMYEKAIDLQKSNELVSAALYGNLMQNILQPANMISYPNAKEMQDFITTCNKQVNDQYQFPVSIETEIGSIEIIGLAPKVTQEGIVCVINYVTDTPLNDSSKSQLEAQGDAIGRAIDTYFQGITNNFDILLAQAFNQIPSDPNKEYVSYTIVIGQ